MEQIGNPFAPEASTGERASSPNSADDALAFDPAPLRYRSDGWTPERQREFVEALADCGIIRQAAARVGMSENSVSQLRRRPEPRGFDLACEAAQRIGARRLHSVAYQRAVEGSIRRHYYHGELKGEERVYDNKLLTFLLGKLATALEPRPESLEVERHWNEWMEAIVRGEPPPEPERMPSECDDVWFDDNGILWTHFPPPEGFGGEQVGTCDGVDYYARTLSAAELAVLQLDQERDLAEQRAARDRFFGFEGGTFSSSMQAEPSPPSETSEPAEAPPLDVNVNPGLSPAATPATAGVSDEPDFDHEARRRSRRHLEQSAGQRARSRRARRAGKGDRGGRRR